jgi:hypothetical protein
MLFDIQEEGEAFYLNIKVSGYVSIDPSIFISGDVYIGFIDIDPQSEENIPNPVPWANFSGSYRYLGSYTGGKGGSYLFTFDEVPKGKYLLLAIVDANGNGVLDLGPSGEPSEPVGLYPYMEDEGAYLIEFDTDCLNIAISVVYNGFFEDFNDGDAQNWVDDSSGRWFVSSLDLNYVMSGLGSINDAFSYYNEYFEDFTYRVRIQQTSGDPDLLRGIFFRSNNPWELNESTFSGYVLQFDGNGNWELIRYDWDGSYSIIGSGFSTHIYPDQPNLLEVSCYGNTFTVSFNGAQVATLIDNMYSDGMVGLFAFDETAGCEFRFDDVTLMW